MIARVVADKAVAVASANALMAVAARVAGMDSVLVAMVATVLVAIKHNRHSIIVYGSRLTPGFFLAILYAISRIFIIPDHRRMYAMGAVGCPHGFRSSAYHD
jgi:hypothetical protein